MSQPPIILETERLLFRQHVIDDLEAFCAMEADPEFRRYVGGQPRPREMAEKRFMDHLNPAPDRMAMWATVFKPENIYIGRCGVYPHFRSDNTTIEGEGSLGLYIATAYSGRGLATEAGRAFVDFAFNELQLNRIVTAIQVGNDASVNVINKLGFELISTEEGSQRSFYHFALEKPAKTT